MKNLLLKYLKLQWLMCLMIGCCFLSCSDNDDESVSDYDPNQSVEVTDFYPTEGSLSTQVILNGVNFGSNKADVKVFFNEKEASVISVKGDKILVLAPKRASTQEDPTCVITVEVQDQTVQYKQTFDYYIQTNITTLVGSNVGVSSNPTGTISLAEAQFRAGITYGMCVDSQKNVFFLVDNDGQYAAYMLNEEADKLKCLKSDIGAFLTAPFLAYDWANDLVYQFQSNIGTNEIRYFDPEADYEPVSRSDISWDSTEWLDAGDWGAWSVKQVFTMDPQGEYMYCRGLAGNFMRVNPSTSKGENLTKNGTFEVGTNNGDTQGLVFDPTDPNIIYFSNTSTHCIHKFNLVTEEEEIWAGQQNTSGYLDGPIGQARFNQPRQMCVDSENNIIIADYGNHCIRKISLNTGYVSTIAGIAQQSGYKNGTSDEAMFNGPSAICIDSEDVMYVGEQGNYAVRRIAVE